MSTPILAIDELASNQIDQFLTANEAFRVLESSSNGVLPVFMSDDVTLTSEQFTRNAMFSCSGHTSAQSLTVPDSIRMFAVHNLGTSSGSLNVVRGSTTISLAVAAPASWFYTDGTTNGLFKIG